MAIFRKVHTSFWSDTIISDLDRDKKLFYLYILTNERTTQCGIYEISKKQISFDLGYSTDTVCKLLQYFIKLGKIRYNEQTKELAVGNWLKYNGSTSPKVKSCIDKEFSKVKDRVLIEYIYSTDTHTQEEEEQEEEKEQEEKIDFDIFYNLYDKKVDGKDSKLKWDKLDLQTQQLILSIVPKYIKSTPDKQFRKSPLVYLNKKAWEDEIIIEKEFNKPVQTYKEPIAKLL